MNASGKWDKKKSMNNANEWAILCEFVDVGVSK